MKYSARLILKRRERGAPFARTSGCTVLLLLLMTVLDCLSAESLKPIPGTTVLPPLAGQAAANHAELLAKLRRLPKEVPSEARTFTSPKSSRDSIRYRLYKPLKFDPAVTYPLVLSLHGGGPRRNFDDLLEPFSPGFAYGIGRLASPETQSKHPAFVIVPWSAGRGWDGANIRLVMGIIDSVRTEFMIDPKRIYVTGQSMGGTGTWTILANHPDVFAAAIPICGWGEPATAKRVKDIPVWVIHGNADTIMPVAGSRDMVKALLKAGAKPIYWEYDGATHAVTAERAYGEPALVDWLFDQVKR
jgi:predicted peptidase